MPLRAFLVEDSKPMQAALAALFESSGGIVVAGIAASEMQATQWLETNASTWDLAVVDLILDGGSGFNVIPRLKQQGRGQVIVFSEFATPAVVARCMALGADAVFSKTHVSEFTDYLAALVAGTSGRPVRRG